MSAPARNIIETNDTDLADAGLPGTRSPRQGEVRTLSTGRPFTWQDGRVRETLPIDQGLGEILEALTSHRVIIVEGETGSGKTTRIAQAALLSKEFEHTYLLQTRRNAVRWNGRRICQELGVEPGTTVGWKLAGESPLVSSETRLTLLIDQSLANRIRQFGGALPDGLTIVDEAHERKISTDVLLGLIKDALDRNPRAKILITSATLDVEKFSRFFDGAPVFKVPGRCFPVRREIVPLQRGEPHSSGAERVVGDILDKFVRGTFTIPGTEGTGERRVEEGSVLVLLPGKEDIRNIERAVERWKQRNPEYAANIECAACHGELHADDQDRVQRHIRPGTLRIVPGTEVLRSSVTVPSTVAVVDTLRIKRSYIDNRGVAHLSTIPVSRAEALQGEGRAGRTNPGVCYVICEPGEYARLDPNPQPEILRAPLTQAVLEIASLGKDPRTFPFIDPPPAEKLEAALTRLTRLGALAKDGSITDLGRELLAFPIDPERAMMMMKARTLGVLPETTVLAGILESEGFFFRPKPDIAVIQSEPEVRHLLRYCEKGSYSWRCSTPPRDPAAVDMQDLPPWIEPLGDGRYRIDGSHSSLYDVAGSQGMRWVADVSRVMWSAQEGDLVTFVRAFRAFKAKERELFDVRLPLAEADGEPRKLSFNQREGRLREWCDAHFINLKRLRQAEHTIGLIADELRHMSGMGLGRRLEAPYDFSAAALTKAFLAGHPDFVGQSSYGSYRGPLGEFQLARESCSPKSPFIVVGGVRKIPIHGRRMSFLHLAEVAAPIETAWFKEVAPQLCSDRLEAEKTYDPARDEVTQRVTSTFLNFEYPGEPRVVSDPRVLAAWLRDGGRAAGSSALEDILTHNKTVLRDAEELTMRAGRPLFPVDSSERYLEWLTDRLNGASRLRDVPHPEQLRLPALDEHVRRTIERESPREILVGDRILTVRYTTDTAPTIVVPHDDMATLRALPHDAVTLPGGRRVRIAIQRYGWNTVDPQEDLGALRRSFAELQAKELCESGRNRPELPALGDLSDPSIPIPDIQRAVCGQDPWSGADLVLYAYPRNNPYSTIPHEWAWTHMQDRAEREYAALRATLDPQRAEQQARLELEAQVREGLALANFEGYHRRGGKTGNADAWVLRADGSERTCDRSDIPRHKSDGVLHWDTVTKDELALRWTCSHTGDVRGNSECEVVKLPAGGCTAAQLAAVGRLEAELGLAPGTFGLDPLTIERDRQLGDALRKYLPVCPASGDEFAWEPAELRQLRGSVGFVAAHGGCVASLISSRMKTATRCDGRDGVIVRTYSIPTFGVVEAIAYEKGGTWNLALRMREFAPGEESHSPVQAVEAPSSLEQQLRGLWGGVQVTTRKGRRS